MAKIEITGTKEYLDNISNFLNKNSVKHSYRPNEKPIYLNVSDEVSKSQTSLRYVIYDIMTEEKLSFKDLAVITNEETKEVELFVRGNNPNYDLEKKLLLINHFNLDKSNFCDFNEN